MSEIRRCDYCRQVTECWFELRIDRMMSGLNINDFRDNPDRDICPACADTLLTPLGVKP